MKLHSLSVLVSAGVVVALLSSGINNGHAASAAFIQNTGDGFAQPPRFEQITWDSNKVEMLAHAYRLLEHADGDYGGHRLAAMKAIKKAAESRGVELHGKETAEESQWKSDRRVREAKHVLEDLAAMAKGREQPHVHLAIKELEQALAVK